MLDFSGPFILVLVMETFSVGGNGAGIAMQEMASFEACKAARVQLEVVKEVTAYCIAKDVRED